MPVVVCEAHFECSVVVVVVVSELVLCNNITDCCKIPFSLFFDTSL